MTDVALKEHLEAQIGWLRDHLEWRFAESQRALEVATRKLEHDFAKVNELREQVTEERGMYPRVELFHALQDRFAALSERVGRLERLIPIVALASAVVGAILTTLAMRLFGLRFG